MHAHLFEKILHRKKLNIIWTLFVKLTLFQNENDKIRRDVRRNILNQRVKMIFNQSVRRQRENSERKRIFSFLQGELRNLYAHGIVDYQMLKVKHKISLWLLLNLKNPKYSLLWTKIAKEF